MDYEDETQRPLEEELRAQRRTMRGRSESLAVYAPVAKAPRLGPDDGHESLLERMFMKQQEMLKSMM